MVWLLCPLALLVAIMLVQAWLLGGHVRIGMEDTVYIGGIADMTKL